MSSKQTIKEMVAEMILLSEKLSEEIEKNKKQLELSKQFLNK